MTITSKATVNSLVQSISSLKNWDEKVTQLDKQLLLEKVKFPLLEYATTELLKGVEEKDYIKLADKIAALNREGGNVMLGIILQRVALQGKVALAFEKAGEYMAAGDEWFVCDIIGERVMGHSLLKMPDKALPLLKKLAKADSEWLVRSVGVATHYATKKGLPKEYVLPMFELLLSMANTTEFHAKTGTGWGAKTIAKFYPDIIQKYHDEIYENPEVKQWFKTKIAIGLSRKEKYAERYNSQPWV